MELLVNSKKILSILKISVNGGCKQGNFGEYTVHFPALSAKLAFIMKPLSMPFCSLSFLCFIDWKLAQRTNGRE